ncbi:MAG: histidine--tRNA ligase [Armatimonadetes bacterium]|nr:histidine--tRNA ligase [Armatimonadota bacterium]
MANPPQAPRGMRDFLPDRMILRHHVTGVFRGVFERYGFEPLDTPAVEYAETLEGKYGEEADKLIYKFEDRGGRRVGLRYDLTVPLARVVAQYPDLPKPFKRYQIAPVWRAERPQKGRYREFWQCDADTVGSTSMLADAEILAVVYTALRELGFPQFVMRLNNRKILKGVAAFAGVPEGEEASVLRSVDKLDKVGEVGVRTELLEKGFGEDVVGRLFELLAPEASGDVLARLRTQLVDNAEAQDGIGELEQVREYLGALGVPEAFCRIDLAMVRGLDYYTGPIFETVVEEPRIGSITGGGRYDHLIGIFSGRDIPAVGSTLGLERIVDVMEALGLFPAAKTLTRVLVTVFDTAAAPESLRLAAELRAAGVCAEVYLAEKGGFRKQLAYANAKGIPLVALLGPDEIARREVTLRNMADGSQESVARGEVVGRLRGEVVGRLRG